MIKVTVAAVALALGISSPAWAQRKDCNDLKGEIEAKIKKNGVDKFTLEIVEKDAKAEGTQSDGKVVGSCDGGTKKIVYKRG